MGRELSAALGNAQHGAALIGADRHRLARFLAL
jgi:hypothetical protein